MHLPSLSLVCTNLLYKRIKGFAQKSMYCKALVTQMIKNTAVNLSFFNYGLCKATSVIFGATKHLNNSQKLGIKDRLMP